MNYWVAILPWCHANGFLSEVGPKKTERSSILRIAEMGTRTIVATHEGKQDIRERRREGQQRASIGRPVMDPDIPGICLMSLNTFVGFPFPFRYPLLFFRDVPDSTCCSPQVPVMGTHRTTMGARITHCSVPSFNQVFFNISQLSQLISCERKSTREYPLSIKVERY